MFLNIIALESCNIEYLSYKQTINQLTHISEINLNMKHTFSFSVVVLMFEMYNLSDST